MFGEKAMQDGTTEGPGHSVSILVGYPRCRPLAKEVHRRIKGLDYVIYHGVATSGYLSELVIHI